MSEYVPVSLRRLVASRAEERCEYCLIHSDDAFLPHEPDHIVTHMDFAGQMLQGFDSPKPVFMLVRYRGLAMVNHL